MKASEKDSLSRPSLLFENCQLNYANESREIERLGLTCDRWVLIGPNGAGKSTFLRVIAGIDELRSGSISCLTDSADSQSGVQAQRLDSRSMAHWSRLVTWVPADQELAFDIQAFQLVELGLLPWHNELSANYVQTRVEDVFSNLGVEKLRDLLWSQLSSGERKLVTLARGMISRAPILLFDEPLAHLDMYYKPVVSKALMDLQATGRLVVVATHELDFARHWGSRILVAQDGFLTKPDDINHILTSVELERIFKTAFVADTESIRLLWKHQ